MQRSIAVVVLLLLSGCANPYMAHYKDTTGGADLSKMAVAPLPGNEPKLVQGTKPDEDNIRMLEDGYGRVGYSYFNAASADSKDALTQAKAVHAEVVIVYSGSTAGGRANYLANYWIKMKSQVLGVHVSELTQQLQVMTGTKQGVYVIAVVKGSAAERSGIQKGDVIRKIGDVELNKAKELRDAVGKLAGQKVTVELWREYQVVQKEVQLDQKQ
jgi:membrane-associated protease RseP (regulator of RpoE activity)